MIEIRKATLQDIEEAAANPLPIFDNGVDHKPGCIHCLNSGVLMAMVTKDGDLCGVMGGFTYWGGVATVGALFTPHLKKYPIAAVRSMMEIIGINQELLGLHRMELAVKTDYKTGQRMAEALGFQVEGLLRKYTADKQDHYMYGRVW